MNRFMDKKTLKWIKGDGPYPDIVFTSRIRLARNLVNIAFPPRARRDDLKKSQKQVDAAYSSHPYFLARKGSSYKNRFVRLELDSLSQMDKVLLAEEYIASPAFINEKGARSVYFNSDASVSFMVNEEDHLRMQALLPGLQIDKAWGLVNKLDDALEAKLDFAYSKNLGYLSTCPTNLGTGMRASVMLHLPAITMMNLIAKIAPRIFQLGLAIRGIYGEGTEAQGHFYQISNQVSLGLKEEDIIEKIKGITLQIIEQENKTRESILKDLSWQVKDRVWRSWGILKSARILSMEESLELLSMIRLGVGMGILPKIPVSMLNELVLLIRPVYLQKTTGRILDPKALELKRADVIRKRVSKY
ncbi:MAG: protein arginine kinase [Armatimonadota bacterium]